MQNESRVIFGDANMNAELLEQAKNSLGRIQSFDSKTLPREDVLGTLSFTEAVEPADQLIDLYKQLSIDVLEQLPDSYLQTIKDQADSSFNVLKSILDFNLDTGNNPKAQRDYLLGALRENYAPVFESLHPLISYSVRKSTDFTRLEREARAFIQNMEDRANALQQELENRRKEADGIIETVRRVAEEQGVSQQAIYFKNEADKHEHESKKWLTATIGLTIGLALYAVATLFLHKIPLLAPINTYETTQLAVSKVLIFLAIFFFLVLSSRNYLAHRHNLVVNRHRQNALVTYQAIVKAAGEDASRDVVLAKAADCIFAAQPTAFSKTDGADSGSLSFVNIAPNGIKPTITP